MKNKLGLLIAAGLVATTGFAAQITIDKTFDFDYAGLTDGIYYSGDTTEKFGSATPGQDFYAKNNMKADVSGDTISMLGLGATNNFQGLSLGDLDGVGLTAKAGETITFSVTAKLEDGVSAGFAWKSKPTGTTKAVSLEPTITETPSSEFAGATVYTSTFTLTEDLENFNAMFSLELDSAFADGFEFTDSKGKKKWVANGDALMGTIYDISIIPEPATFGLFGLASAGLMAYRRRRNRD